MRTTIGIDVGGTKIAGAVVRDGQVLARARRETGIPSAESVAGACADLVRELAQHHDVSAVGMAVAGFVDRSGAHVVYGTNLGMHDEPMKQRMESLVDLPVILDNDANAAAWGEFCHGAGRDSDDMMLVTVGTGIGGGIVIDRRLLRGAYGFAAEIGHIRVTSDGPQCGCGNRGCWEVYASGTALLRAAKALVSSGTPHAARLRAACGGRAKDLKGQAITELALQGDLASIELLEDLGQRLGQGCADMTAVLDPEMIVVGGGVVEAGDLLLEPARRTLARSLTARGHRPVARIVPALLGNDAGMIGAAALAADAFSDGTPTGRGVTSPEHTDPHTHNDEDQA